MFWLDLSHKISESALVCHCVVILPLRSIAPKIQTIRLRSRKISQKIWLVAIVSQVLNLGISIAEGAHP
jgi:hypothetical protein